MVLAERVGRKRPFVRGLLLTVVTFGVYAVYWNYKAHNEVYRQFELAREGRDEGMVWYVLGLVVPPFLLAYLWVMASNVAYVRQRIGLRRGMTPGRFVGLLGVGVGALVVGLLLLEAALVAQEAASDAEAPPDDAATQQAGAALLALGITATVLVALAYRGLQRDVNELWDAYEVRIAWLRSHPETLLAAPPASAPQDPALAALVEAEALVARATLGEAGALEAARARLAQARALLEPPPPVTEEAPALLPEGAEAEAPPPAAPAEEGRAEGPR